MIADFMTKPLQGGTFIRFRNIVLGITARDFDEYRKQFYQIIKQYGLHERGGNGDSSSSNLHKSKKPQECVERAVSSPKSNAHKTR